MSVAASPARRLRWPGLRHLLPGLLPGLLAAAALAPSPTQAGVDTVVGRQAPLRADAPSLSVTRHARAAYVLHCAGCHGMQGEGQPARYLPDLRRVGLFLRLDGGREFVVRVPGLMGSGLGDAEAAEVTNWVLVTLAADSVPSGHRPYTADEIARARARPLVDVAAERRRLVEQARAAGIALD